MKKMTSLLPLLLVLVVVPAVLVVVAGEASANSLGTAEGVDLKPRDGGITTDKSTIPGGFNDNLAYTGGPNVCGKCHPDAFETWMTHGHSGKIVLGAMEAELGESPQKIDVGDRGHLAGARVQGYPLPRHDNDLFNWDNILFIVGGTKHWKSRFVDLKGYFITKNGDNQYNWEVGEWVDYNADVVEKPFDCGSCHTTGYRPEGTAFMPEIPGIVGDFSHINITCEACHGPGAAHAADPSSDNIMIDDSAAQCGTCHTRGTDDSVIIASGGFIRHHEQYPEQLNSPHSFLKCVSCHDAHEGRYAGISKECSECHPSEAADYAGSSMAEKGVSCEDCHMGFVGKSARKNGPYEGDVWTHLFRIDSSADYDMFNRDGDGNTVSAKDAINLEFACFRCHADASKTAYAGIGDDGEAYHTLGK